MNRVEARTEGIDSPPWIDKFKSIILEVMEKLEIKNAEISLLLCNDAVIRELNRKYRGRDASTDVLSFSQMEGDEGYRIADGIETLGDIVISLDTVRENAKRENEDYENELKRVAIHGILHLLGYEHQEGEESPMIIKQEKILKDIMEEKLV